MHFTKKKERWSQFCTKDKFTQKKEELKWTKMWLQDNNFLGWNIDQVAHDLFGHHTKLSNMRSLVAICFCRNQKIANHASIGSVYQSNIQQATSQWTERVFGSDREPLPLLVALYSFVPIMVKADDGNDLNSEVYWQMKHLKAFTIIAGTPYHMVAWILVENCCNFKHCRWQEK